jgi:hypothetical protein
MAAAMFVKSDQRTHSGCHKFFGLVARARRVSPRPRLQLPLLYHFKYFYWDRIYAAPPHFIGKPRTPLFRKVPGYNI